jgi:hypothetical protein
MAYASQEYALCYAIREWHMLFVNAYVEFVNGIIRGWARTHAIG